MSPSSKKLSLLTLSSLGATEMLSFVAVLVNVFKLGLLVSPAVDPRACVS